MKNLNTTHLKSLSQYNVEDLKKYTSQLNWQYLVTMALSFIFGVLILYSLINTAIFFFSQDSNKQVNAAIPTSKTTVSLVKELPQQHLFGLSTTGSITTITSLNLTLTGVVVTNNANNSVAFLSPTQTPDAEKPYHINDMLPGGAKLYSIRPDGIIIQYMGRLERLPLILTNADNTSAQPTPVTMDQSAIEQAQNQLRQQLNQPGGYNNILKREFNYLKRFHAPD